MTQQEHCYKSAGSSRCSLANPILSKTQAHACLRSKHATRKPEPHFCPTRQDRSNPNLQDLHHTHRHAQGVWLQVSKQVTVWPSGPMPLGIRLYSGNSVPAHTSHLILSCVSQGTGGRVSISPEPLKISKYLNKQDDLAGGQIRGLRSAVLGSGCAQAKAQPTPAQTIQSRPLQTQSLSRPSFWQAGQGVWGTFSQAGLRADPSPCHILQGAEGRVRDVKYHAWHLILSRRPRLAALSTQHHRTPKGTQVANLACRHAVLKVPSP